MMLCRGHVARGKLDKPTLEKTRAIGIKLQEMRRRQKASSKVGAWYRAHQQQRRYQATKRKAIKVQALCRVLLAKRAKAREAKADLVQSREEFQKGWRLDKYYASGQWKEGLPPLLCLELRSELRLASPTG